MSHLDPNLHLAFGRKVFTFVKVTPQGFVVFGELLDALRGRVLQSHLVRKRFEQRMLVCSSKDGQIASNGTFCHECQHPQCRPLLRLQLVQGLVVYVLDLATTSARNFLEVEAEAAEGNALGSTELILRVLDRGAWGEVVFARNSASQHDQHVASQRLGEPQRGDARSTRLRPDHINAILGETEAGSAEVQPAKG